MVGWAKILPKTQQYENIALPWEIVKPQAAVTTQAEQAEAITRLDKQV